MYNFKKLAILSTLCTIMTQSQMANAASTANTTFAVTSSVVASCTISATSLAFGNYTLSQLDATSTLTLTCTSGTAAAIGLNAGTGSGATVTVRKMTSAGNTLNYALYQDAGRTTIWGNTVGTDTVSTTGTGAAQTITVYGRIPASQTSPIGSYADTVTATVTF
jgi:spore coat protein U-like protein